LKGTFRNEDDAEFDSRLAKLFARWSRRWRIKYRGSEAPKIHVSARRQGYEWEFSVRLELSPGSECELREPVAGMLREPIKARTAKIQSTDAQNGDGFARSSVESSVMDEERRGGDETVE
jgi:hypothetical protein